ncbi:MAG: Gfo/Idh/MocA family oxidoreductase [Rhodospirillaceae bacterium]|nr:Gfo/Idh/MocA family oxidoreductase [Rhodospirillaceae bacterium]
MPRSPKDISSGIVGARGIGAVHLRELVAAGSGTLNIVGQTLENTRATALRLSQTYNIPVGALASVAKLGAVSDFVSVCSPNALHLEHAHILLAKGCYVFVEKPFFWMNGLTRRRVDDLTHELFDQADGRLCVNYPTAHFAAPFIATCGRPQKLTDFWFRYQTRGNYAGPDIAVDLLPHAFSLLLEFTEGAQVKNLSVQEKEGTWVGTFQMGDTRCVFEFVQAPQATMTDLSFAINGQTAQRIQRTSGAGFQVLLDIPGAIAAPMEITNPMVATIHAAFAVCVKTGRYTDAQELNHNIMKRMAEILIP